MFKQRSELRVKRVGIASLVVTAMLISGVFIMTPAVDTAKGDILGGEYGGTLRVALAAAPNTLNPLNDSANEPAKQVMDLIYDSLGRVNPYNLELEPWTAASWTVDSTNSSQVTVALRSDVKWHSGASLTPADVKYTYGSNGHNVPYVDDMILDTTNNSITFLLDAPDARFFSELLTMKLVPANFVYSGSSMIGGGPFKFSSMDSTSTEILAYDDYFNGRPYLDSIVYTYYPFDDVTYPPTGIEDDPRSEGVYRAGFDLINGDIDMIGWSLTSNDTTLMIEIPYASKVFTNLVQYENVSVQRSNGMDFWYLGMNSQAGHELNDVALRTAISHAIDKAALTVFDIGGGLEVTDSILSKYNTPWYNSSIMKYDYDITEANSILNAAGYYDYDGDGWRDKPDKSKMDFTLLGPPEEDLTPKVMAGIIESWIQSLGINVTLILNTTEVHMVDILADNYDMFLATEMNTGLDPGFLESMFHSDKIATDDNILNFAPISDQTDEKLNGKFDANNVTYLEYTNIIDANLYLNGTVLGAADYTLDKAAGMLTLLNPLDLVNMTLTANYTFYEFDHLIEKANSQMDAADRSATIKEVQGYLSEQAPNIPLFSFRVNHAYNNTKLVGWVQSLDGINNFWTFINLRNPLNEGNMVISLSVPPDVTDDGAKIGGDQESFNINVKVEDIDGNAIEGVDLTPTGEGTFDASTYADGTYVVPYTIPYTNVSRTITLTMKAAIVSYGTGYGSIDITIHPDINDFKISASKGNSSIKSGNSTTVTFTVLDSGSAPVEGANVTFSVSPTSLGGSLNEYSNTTNANGQITVTFSTNNVSIDTTFKITARISMEGFNDAEKSTSISVSKESRVEPKVSKGFLGLPAPSMFIVLVTFASMALVFNIRRRRK